MIGYPIRMNAETERKIAIPRMFKEGLLVVNFLVAVFLFVALFSYSPEDPGFSNTGSGGDVGNAAGFYGAWLADVLFLLLGYLAWVVPAWLVYLCIAAVAGREAFRGLFVFRASGLVLILLSAGGLASLHLESTGGLPNDLRLQVGTQRPQSGAGYAHHRVLVGQPDTVNRLPPQGLFFDDLAGAVMNGAVLPNILHRHHRGIEKSL